jgi:hypothetical protein
MIFSTNNADYQGMARYSTPLWEAMERLQNGIENRDILTITGFMKTADELIAHYKSNGGE